MHQEMGPMSRTEWLLLILLLGGAIMFALGKGSPIYQLHSYPLGIIGLIGIMILFIPACSPSPGRRCRTAPSGAPSCCWAAR